MQTIFILANLTTLCRLMATGGNGFTEGILLVIPTGVWLVAGETHLAHPTYRVMRDASLWFAGDKSSISNTSNVNI